MVLESSANTESFQLGEFQHQTLKIIFKTSNNEHNNRLYKIFLCATQEVNKYEEDTRKVFHHKKRPDDKGTQEI